MKLNTSSNLLSLAEATQILPGRPSVSTLHRWRMRGIKGVKLDTVLVGGRRFVSIEALEQFIAATTAAAEGKTALMRPSRQREIEKAAAARQLDAANL